MNVLGVCLVSFDCVLGGVLDVLCGCFGVCIGGVLGVLWAGVLVMFCGVRGMFRDLLGTMFFFLRAALGSF